MTALEVNPGCDEVQEMPLHEGNKKIGAAQNQQDRAVILVLLHF